MYKIAIIKIYRIIKKYVMNYNKKITSLKNSI